MRKRVSDLRRCSRCNVWCKNNHESFLKLRKCQGHKNELKSLQTFRLLTSTTSHLIYSTFQTCTSSSVTLLLTSTPAWPLWVSPASSVSIWPKVTGACLQTLTDLHSPTDNIIIRSEVTDELIRSECITTQHLAHNTGQKIVKEKSVKLLIRSYLSSLTLKKPQIMKYFYCQQSFISYRSQHAFIHLQRTATNSSI